MNGTWQSEIDMRRDLRDAEQKFKTVTKEIQKLSSADQQAVDLLVSYPELIIFHIVTYCTAQGFDPEKMIGASKMADVFTALADALASVTVARFTGFTGNFGMITDVTVQGRWATIGKFANLRRDAGARLVRVREEVKKHEMAERAKLLLAERFKP